MKPNPWFVVNGHVDKEDQDASPPVAKASSRTASPTGFTNDETASPLTQAYLRTRDYKTIGSSMMGIGAGVAAVHTGGVNVANTPRVTSTRRARR